MLSKLNKKKIFGVITIIFLLLLILIPSNQVAAQDAPNPFNPIENILNIGAETANSIATGARDSSNKVNAWCEFDLLSLCGIVNGFFLGIPYVFGFVGAQFLIASSFLVDIFFSINTEIFKAQGSMISGGFRFTLHIANMGFIIALIIIAFATILRIEEYSARKLLGKLIVYAVLINFSMFFAGLILDFSHVLAHSFLYDASSAQSIASSLNVQQYLVAPLDPTYSPEQGMVPLSSSNWWSVLTIAIFMMCFAWMMFFVMLAIAIMFLIRYISLVILIILMPLAWVTPLLPKMKGLNERWWNSFLKQAFFLPAACLFIALALRGADALGDISFFNTIRDSYKHSELLGFKMVIQQLLSVFIVGGLLIGALKAGSEVGGASAKIGLNMANKIKGAGVKYVAKPIGKQALDTSTKTTRKTLARAGAGILKVGQYIIPHGKATRNKLMKAADWKPEVEKYKENNLNNLTKDQLKKEGKQILGNRKISSAGILSKYIELGMLNDPDITDKKLHTLAKSGKNLLSAEDKKKLLFARPDLAPSIDDKKTASQAVRKMPPGKAADWDAKMLDNDEVFLEVANSKALLRSIALNGSEELRAKLINRLENTKTASTPEYKEKHDQMRNKISEIETVKRRTNNPKQLEKLSGELKKIKSEMDKVAKNIAGVNLGGALEYVNQTISGKTRLAPEKPEKKREPNNKSQH